MPEASSPVRTHHVLFDAEGAAVQQEAIDEILADLDNPPSDVFVMAHGWNNSPAEARQTYGTMLSLMGAVADDHALRPEGFRPLAVGIIWPSKAWDSSDQESAVADEDEDALARAVYENFPPGRSSPLRYSADVLAMRDFLSRDRLSPAERARFFQLLRRYALPPATSEEESVFDADTGSEEAALEGAFSPRDAFRVFTFWQMKKRAGVVGGLGVRRLLSDMQQACPDTTRFHLIGHSFGCKLLLAAVADPDRPLPRPVQTLVLIQGALSFQAFAAEVTGRHAAGGYAQALAADRVSGPIAVTYSRHDIPLTRFYPLGARAAGQRGELEAAPSVYSALGAVGAAGVTGAPTQSGTIGAEGADYGFAGHGVWNLNGSNGTPPAIAGHSDFKNRAIAWMIWSAVRTR